MQRMKSAAPPGPESTPFGRLVEGGMHQLVGYQLALANIATSQIFAAQVGGPLDLRKVEFTLLMLIHENPGVSASQLARALAVTAPNIKLWIDRLAQRGLAERVPSPTDRRAQHLRATTSGATLVSDALALLLAAEQVGLNNLTSGERAILVELLHKVARCRAKPAG